MQLLDLAVCGVLLATTRRHTLSASCFSTARTSSLRYQPTRTLLWPTSPTILSLCRSFSRLNPRAACTSPLAISVCNPVQSARSKALNPGLDLLLPNSSVQHVCSCINLQARVSSPSASAGPYPDSQPVACLALQRWQGQTTIAPLRSPHIPHVPHVRQFPDFSNCEKPVTNVTIPRHDASTFTSGSDSFAPPGERPRELC